MHTHLASWGSNLESWVSVDTCKCQQQACPMYINMHWLAAGFEASRVNRRQIFLPVDEIPSVEEKQGLFLSISLVTYLWSSIKTNISESGWCYFGNIFVKFHLNLPDVILVTYLWSSIKTDISESAWCYFGNVFVKFHKNWYFRIWLILFW